LILLGALVVLANPTNFTEEGLFVYLSSILEKTIGSNHRGFTRIEIVAVRNVQRNAVSHCDEVTSCMQGVCFVCTELRSRDDIVKHTRKNHEVLRA
jgi:hypothetical protein